MAKPFESPSGPALSAIDVASVPYENSCTIIEGVVSPKGHFLSSEPSDNYDVYYFEFAAWRRPDESLSERKLTLLQPLPPSLDQQGRQVNVHEWFANYSIQRLSVLISKDQTRAVVEKVLTLEKPSRELKAFADRLRRQVVISTDRFGNLTLDRRTDWFECTAEWNDSTIQVHFENEDQEDITDLIKTAEVLWSDQESWRHKIDDFAVMKLLDGVWLEPDHGKVTAKDFKARMTLKSITIGSDGQFEFWHDDGELYWGHSIQISGNLKDGPTDATIAG